VTAAAPTIQAFFVTRLGSQFDASPQTIDSYRHAFRLLLTYAETETGKHPADLDLADLDASLISGFLDHLETARGNSVASRNTRLAAIHSFFRFASYRHPEHAQTIRQILDIPQKKAHTVPRSFLTEAEMNAVLSAPDRSTWSGRRDHALLAVTS
jgi:site-specific recombinase XerD